MKLSIVAITILFFLPGTEILAQKHGFDSNLPKTITKEISSDNDKHYELIITLPPDYQPEKEYKILYYLDAWWLEGLVTGCYRIKSLANKSLQDNMDELILVGISSVGNEEAWNVQRNFDYTPSKYNLNVTISTGRAQMNESTTGGAKEFLDFFENKIIASVEGEYKVDSTSRGILGHSLGGLLGFYAYLHHSHLFSNYILIAPSVWWNSSELLADKASLVSKSKANMFVSVGANEIGMMKRPMADLVEGLEQEKNAELNMTYKQYENADHHSVLPQSVYDAIEFIYVK